MAEPKIALVFDFDDTLAPDSTSYLLAEEAKLNSTSINAFWAKVTEMVEDGWDPPIAYMNRLLALRHTANIDLTKERMRALGAQLKPFDGLPDLFPRLKGFVDGVAEFRDAGIRLEFHVISGGLEEVIRGSSIAEHMNGIFGCTFEHDAGTGQPVAIKSAISFTEKTRFLFGIHKGFSEREQRQTPYVVNDAMEPEARPIPLSSMIYIGDGPSDIPCFSVVKEGKGNSIGIKRPKKKKSDIGKGFELARGERTTQGPYRADYRDDSEMTEAIEDAILATAYKICSRRRESRIGGPRHG